MKVVLLAGGFGTRLSEATNLIPKPMVEIGGKPILWHIMKTYSHYGFNEFVICCGYKAYVVKEWFANYFLHNSDITISLADNSIEVHNNKSEPWKVTLVDTGLNTMTGGRIKRIQEYIGNERFLLTYGDGLSDLNILDSIKHHQTSGKLITVMAHMLESKFGGLDIDKNGDVTSFTEKSSDTGNWINAGYFICEPEVFGYITDGDASIFEKKPLENLAKDGKMTSYKHSGFWKPMDTLKDNTDLNTMWDSGKAPWKVW